MAVIYERRIFELFHELALWMSKRQLHADVAVDGGCSLLLQTHFRRSVNDFDLVFSQVTDRFSQLLDREKLARLHWDFVGESDQANGIDKAYIAAFVKGTSLPSPTLPYVTIRDEHGFGATFHLVTLDSIFQSKQLFFHMNDQHRSKLDRFAQSEIDPELAEMLRELRDDDAFVEPGKMKKINHDGHALGILLNKEWDGLPIDENDRAITQAKRGRKPIKYRIELIS